MKKSSLIASAALITLTLSSAPVFAQGGPFADVPTDHWAYASVDRLQKRGIVIGYPDGTFGGKRPMTRYEFAVAIARLLTQMQTATTAPPIDTSQFATKSDLNNYALKSDLAPFATKDDVAALRKLVSEFQTELTTLGVDIDAVKKRLDALEGRVKAIEDELSKMVRVSGVFNVYSRSNNRFKTDIGNGKSALSVRDKDGFEVTGGYGSRGGFLADTRVFNDLDLNIKAKVSDKVTFDSTLNFGNYLPFLNSISSYSGFRSARNVSPNGLYPGQRVNQDQIQTVYKAMIDGSAPIPLLGNVSFQAGRVPFQLTPYTLKLIDVDYYFDNDKTDSGNIPLDGIKGNANFGPVGVTGFAMKVDPIRFVSNEAPGTFPTDGFYGLYAGAGRGAYRSPGTVFGANRGLQAGFMPAVAPDGFGFLTGNRPVGSLINPASNGAMTVEQLAGARAQIGRKGVGTLGGTYMYLSGSPTVRPEDVVAGPDSDMLSFDRVAVYGADFEGSLYSIGLYGSYTKTDTGGNRVENGVVNGDTKTKTKKKNEAWDVSARLGNQKHIALSAGYRQIGPYFAAPGYWGRIGSLTNPVDIKGPYGTIRAQISNAFSATADGHWYKGTGDAVNNGGLSEDDKLTNYRLGLKYGLGTTMGLDFAVDYTEYNILNAAATGREKPTETYYDLGFGYMLSPQSRFRIGYQFINYDDKKTGFDTINGKGGVLTSNFSVRF